MPRITRVAEMAVFSRIAQGICLAVGVLVCMHTAADGIYKWVDEEGRVHYGEKPPHANAERIEIREPSGATPTVRQYNVDRDKMLQIMEEERLQKQVDERNAEQERQALAEKCATIEKRLAEMQRGGRVYTRDENGERVYLTEEEVTAEINRMQKAHKQHCE